MLANVPRGREMGNDAISRSVIKKLIKEENQSAFTVFYSNYAFISTRFNGGGDNRPLTVLLKSVRNLNIMPIAFILEYEVHI